MIGGGTVIFGKTVEIHYDSKGAYAVCSYKGNQEFLNEFFDAVRSMGVSDDADYPAYFLEPIVKQYFKKKAYRDFVGFLVSNGLYSDSCFKKLITNSECKPTLERVSAVICSYRFAE